jgi:hypothetical protein
MSTIEENLAISAQLTGYYAAYIFSQIVQGKRVSPILGQFDGPRSHSFEPLPFNEDPFDVIAEAEKLILQRAEPGKNPVHTLVFAANVDLPQASTGILANFYPENTEPLDQYLICLPYDLKENTNLTVLPPTVLELPDAVLGDLGLYTTMLRAFVKGVRSFPGGNDMWQNAVDWDEDIFLQPVVEHLT